MTPKISIITVTYNARATLEATLKSVFDQPFTDYEYILIDGKSTDGTLELIQQYADRFSYWVSEPDKGIYEAMNKGIDHARGEWLYFLGADDQLLPGVLAEVAPALAESPDVLYGDVKFTDHSYYHSKFSWKTALNNTVHHQGTFYKQTLFRQFRYDTALKIMSDYELNLMIYRNPQFVRKRFEQAVALCAPNGASADPTLSLKELNQLRSRHFPVGIRHLLAGLTTVKYFLHYDLLRKIQR
ncbi:glycosyltransferase family 2 protein [Tellurirhabdus bombi]|uniref:glycosyltransferase family 2 protein n=1 Tax=Tellurirhabdus bombi TaxID=2907205 RepID=UPI001F3D234B|nr:glycosyltransferase family 2 protein [Tellurirhabdus bombi]